MSRSKLRELGIDLPILPTTSVGSFPKPEGLVKARADFAQGKIQREELAQAEKVAVNWWIRKQEELGVDVLVDGELYRGDMVAYFADQFSGFEQGGLVRSYGNRYYHKPIIVGEVKWKDPITVEWWQYTQGLTGKPVKGMLTGAYTLMDWSFNEFYPTRLDACLALAIEAMQMVTRHLRAYFITHICYGDFERIYPGMLELAVDNFDLDVSNSRADMLPLFRKTPFTKDISYGVVDVHSHLIENPDLVELRLKNALEVLPHENVWVDPDCGLKTRTVDEAIAKLKAVVSAAEAVRGA